MFFCDLLLLIFALYNEGRAYQLLPDNIHMAKFRSNFEPTIKILKESCNYDKIPAIDANDNKTIDDDIIFQTDFFKCKGSDLYNRISGKRSQYLLSQLSGASIGIMNIAQISTEKVLVNWNVTFIPETVTFLNLIGKIG